MNRLRFRSGQVQLRKVNAAANSVIEAGDLIWLDGQVARPASEFTWNTDLATTQADFATSFLGVAHQPSASGSGDPITVDISPSSVYEFDTSAATFTLGDTLGCDENAAALMNQQLEHAAAAQAIARAAESTGSGTTSVRVTLSSAYCTGSSNVNAAIG